MSLVHIDGNFLGCFDYDSDVFRLMHEGYNLPCLLYIGSETDGSNIHIPDGMKSCYNMFRRCDFLETAPVIPDGVVNCDYMFSHCTALKQPPVIPDGVVSCRGMFYFCESLVDAPEIPRDVVNCGYMFSHCGLLKKPPEIPSMVENCDSMFEDCWVLEYAPVIPNGVKNCKYMFRRCLSLNDPPVVPSSVVYTDHMFDGCSDSIQKAGVFNIAHREVEYPSSKVLKQRILFYKQCKQDSISKAKLNYMMPHVNDNMCYDHLSVNQRQKNIYNVDSSTLDSGSYGSSYETGSFGDDMEL